MARSLFGTLSPQPRYGIDLLMLRTIFSSRAHLQISGTQYNYSNHVDYGLRLRSIWQFGGRRVGANDPLFSFLSRPTSHRTLISYSFYDIFSRGLDNKITAYPLVTEEDQSSGPSAPGHGPGGGSGPGGGAGAGGGGGGPGGQSGPPPPPPIKKKPVGTHTSYMSCCLFPGTDQQVNISCNSSWMYRF